MPIYRFLRKKIVLLTAAELHLFFSGLDLAKLRPHCWDAPDCTVAARRCGGNSAILAVGWCYGSRPRRYRSGARWSAEQYILAIVPGQPLRFPVLEHPLQLLHPKLGHPDFGRELLLFPPQSFALHQ